MAPKPSFYIVDDKKSFKRSLAKISDKPINDMDSFVNSLLTHGFKTFEARKANTMIIAFDESNADVTVGDIYVASQVTVENKMGKDLTTYKYTNDKFERDDQGKKVKGPDFKQNTKVSLADGAFRSIWAAAALSGVSHPMGFSFWLQANYNAWINSILFSQIDLYNWSKVPIFINDIPISKPSDFSGNSSDADLADLSKGRTGAVSPFIETMDIKGLTKLIQNTATSTNGALISNANKMLGTAIYNKIIIKLSQANATLTGLGIPIINFNVLLKNSIVELIEGINEVSHLSKLFSMVKLDNFKKLLRNKLRTYDASITSTALKDIINFIDRSDSNWHDLSNLIMSKTSETSKYYNFPSNIIGLAQFVEALDIEGDFSEDISATKLEDGDITLLNDITMDTSYVTSILNNANIKGFVQPGVAYIVSLEFKKDDPGIKAGKPKPGTIPKIKTSGGKIINNAAITRMLRIGYKKNYFKLDSGGPKNVKKYVFQFKLPETRTITNENFYKEFANILKKSVSVSL